MIIVEAGHIYRLNWLDAGKGSPEGADLLTFVNRKKGTRHGGTQTQEVIRALIDRTMHCDNCVRWPGNDRIIGHLRAALVLHEARALERTAEKLSAPYVSEGTIAHVEDIEIDQDGHFRRSYSKRSPDSIAYADLREKEEDF